MHECIRMQLYLAYSCACAPQYSASRGRGHPIHLSSLYWTLYSQTTRSSSSQQPLIYMVLVLARPNTAFRVLAASNTAFPVLAASNTAFPVLAASNLQLFLYWQPSIQAGLPAQYMPIQHQYSVEAALAASWPPPRGLNTPDFCIEGPIHAIQRQTRTNTGAIQLMGKTDPSL